MALTDTAVRALKPGDRPLKVSDEKGLFLFVTPSGSKLWRMKYRFLGKEKLLAFGPYPEISLKDARCRRDDARRLLANGVDPGMLKQSQKSAARKVQENSFESIAREWFVKQSQHWSDHNKRKVIRLLERDVFPRLGARPIAELKPLDVLKVIQITEGRGALVSARSAMQICGRVFRYGVATGRCERDVTVDLKGALTPPKVKHMAAFTDPVQVGAYLRSVDAFHGTFQVQCALRLLPLLFCRPGELRRAEWAEFDLDAGIWSIPAERMKMRKAHMVPLPRQAVVILSDLHPITGDGRYVMTGRDSKKPMSDMTVNAALRRLGYDTGADITGHGFRAMARTLLHEQLDVAPEIIEHQLAHRVPDVLGAAYNRTKFIEQRKVMMQRWADYLDRLKRGARIVPLRRA